VIADIYNYYVVNTAIAFELECITPYKISQKIEQCQRNGLCLIYEKSQIVIGYAYVLGFDQRIIPAASESAIYLKNGFEGKGIGFELYSELLSKTVCQTQCIIAGITAFNIASIRLHEKFGFTKVPYFSKTTRKFGQWIDLEFWQKSGLENADERLRP
jgi:phosphinothricin acetyltransferase